MDVMQAVLTETYCAFCEVVANAFSNIAGFGDSINRGITASRLAATGNYDAAKQMMLDD
jgi:hypothetical protein